MTRVERLCAMNRMVMESGSEMEGVGSSAIIFPTGTTGGLDVYFFIQVLSYIGNAEI